VGLVVAIAVNPLAAQAVGGTVQPEFFGMHDDGMDSPLPYGAVRLWDTNTTWADLEPAQDQFQFDHLDTLVAQARAKHAKITLVLGATPQWAATDPNSLSSAWLTPGSSSPPRATADWVDFVRTVVTRYQGVIDSYQIWNEASLPQFWSSTPTRLAQLTSDAYRTIKQADRNAIVVSTPMLPRQPTWATWSTAYLKALRAENWPIDVFAIHSYQPDKLATPAGRVLGIQKMQALLAAAHAPRRPMWDTEANYTSNAFAHYKITGQKAASWVARAYLDSLRLGISRTYWYAWGAVVGHLGVTVGDHTSAALGYQGVRGWLLGSTFRGCTATRASKRVTVTSCTLRRGAKTSRVIWASGKANVMLSGKGTTVCRLLTGCSPRTRKTQVTTDPVLVR
jgi:polysaccharide biosynthesis protein PslG